MMHRLFPLLLVAAPTAAFAYPVWSSNFESGDLSAWTSVQAVSPDRVQIVSSPVKEGSKALKVTVHQGDDPIHSHNDRAELIYQTQEAPGSEYWYHWNVLFPEDYPNWDKWQLFTQWHQNGLNGSPPLEMYVVGNEIRLRANATEPPLWRAPLERGVWQDFILHVKWSPDPSVGFVELYRNGELALPKTYVANQFPGDTNYLKMGLYRAHEIVPSATIYFDDVKMGTEMADVMPAQPIGSQPGVDTGSNTGETSGSLIAPGSDPSQPNSASPDQAGCSAGGAAALPIAVALGLIALAPLIRRRRAAVALPVRSARSRSR